MTRKRNLRMLALTGLILISFGIIPVTNTEECINTSFEVNVGSQYGPYDEGTVYHTRVLGVSILRGHISIIGECILFTANGQNTQHLNNIYIDSQFSFNIDPADDQYTFVFNNTEGDSVSHLGFMLEEVWTRPIVFVSLPLLVIGLLGTLFFLIGSVALGVSHFKD